MISYKKIDLLQLSIDEDFNLTHCGEIVEIKSPIITFKRSDTPGYISLIVNPMSDVHTLFLNINEHISRLFKLKNKEYGVIDLVIDSKYNCKIFNNDYNIINEEKMENGGKIICSYVIINGVNICKQVLLIQ